jgi:hypothetical protein
MKLTRMSAAMALLCILSAVRAFGQMQLVGEAKTDSFPHIAFQVHHRDPLVRAADAFTLEDGGKEVEFTLKDSQPNDSGHHKSILILWEYLPAAARDAQNKYFRQVIQRALPDLLLEGDVVNIATFAWTDQQDGAATISLFQPDFSSDTAGLRQAVTIAKAPGGKGIGAGHGAEIYPAIDEAIDAFEGEDATAKIIIVLSAEFPKIFNPSTDQASVQDKALKEYVAIYNRRYRIMAEKYSLDDLAANTYGQSAEVDPKNVAGTVGTMLSMADGAVQRALGVDYTFAFNSATPPDGKTHPLQLKSGNDTLAITYHAPSLGLGGWIKANLVLFILLILVVVGAGVGIMLWLRKRGQQEAERRADEQRKLADVQSKGKDTEDKLQQQKSQLERMQGEEQERKRRADEAKRQEEIARETEVLLKEMYANGRQPRLTTIVQGHPLTMELPSPVTTVGRDASCDVHNPDPTISRTHFQVNYHQGKYTLLDLGSTNGTLLNGERAHQVELRHGDQIKAGEAILFFYI